MPGFLKLLLSGKLVCMFVCMFAPQAFKKCSHEMKPEQLPYGRKFLRTQNFLIFVNCKIITIFFHENLLQLPCLALYEAHVLAVMRNTHLIT